jgi:hypothetical protein
MSKTICHRTIALAVLVSGLCTAIPAKAGNVEDVTIKAETTARLTLQSQINSKLSEVVDVITATLAEPIYVDGGLVIPRGAEFQGRIVALWRAKRIQRSSCISIDFERVITSSGVAVPISAQVTAIDDWDHEESLKANNKGKMKGGHSGGRTIDNMSRGTSLGGSAGFVGALLGGASGATGRHLLGIGGAGMAAGMIGGLLLTKGNAIRVNQGTILRIRFLKHVALPVQEVSSTN